MQRDNRTFLMIPYLSHKFCSEFGIGGAMAGTTPVFNSARRDFIGYIGTSNGGRIPSSLHHSTDELTLHQFGAVCGERQRDSSKWLLTNLYGVQSRFCSLGTTNSGAGGHRRRTNQVKSRNETTATAGGKPTQG